MILNKIMMTEILTTTISVINATALHNGRMQLSTSNIETCTTICESSVQSPSAMPHHDDVIQWKHFPRYWLFVQGIHRSAVNSPHKCQPATRNFEVFFDLRQNKRLSKQSRRQWFETPSRSLWPHYNVMIMGIVVEHYFKCHSCNITKLELYETVPLSTPFALQWRYNERTGVSNHQPLECLLDRLYMPRSKKVSKRHWPLWGNSPVTGEFPTQRATSNAENVSVL